MPMVWCLVSAPDSSGRYPLFLCDIDTFEQTPKMNHLNEIFSLSPHGYHIARINKKPQTKEDFVIELLKRGADRRFILNLVVMDRVQLTLHGKEDLDYFQNKKEWKPYIGYCQSTKKGDSND